MQNAGVAEFGLRASENLSVAYLQDQVGRFLLQGKNFLLCDMADSSSIEGKVSAAIKQKIYDGVKKGTFANNNCMKYFLNTFDVGLLSSHVAMLTLHSIIKDFDLDSDQQKEAIRKSLNPQSVCVPMAFYVFLICIANPKFTPSKFNNLFANSWVEYYNSHMVKCLMIQMNGPRWKNQFRGCLFDD